MAKTLAKLPLYTNENKREANTVFLTRNPAAMQLQLQFSVMSFKLIPDPSCRGLPGSPTFLQLSSASVFQAFSLLFKATPSSHQQA